MDNKNRASAMTEAQNIIVTSDFFVDQVEFKQLLKDAPAGKVTDSPLPLKRNIVSKESCDDQF